MISLFGPSSNVESCALEGEATKQADTSPALLRSYRTYTGDGLLHPWKRAKMSSIERRALWGLSKTMCAMYDVCSLVTAQMMQSRRIHHRGGHSAVSYPASRPSKKGLANSASRKGNREEKKNRLFVRLDWHPVKIPPGRGTQSGEIARAFEDG